MIVAKFIDLMKEVDDSAFVFNGWKSMFQGFVFFTNFLTNAVSFLIAGAVMQSTDKYNTKQVMTAIFAMLFSSNMAGMTLGRGPDIGKAQSSAEVVFDVYDEPSEINAIEMDKKEAKD